jgi:hypothetical protein
MYGNLNENLHKDFGDGDIIRITETKHEDDGGLIGRGLHDKERLVSAVVDLCWGAGYGAGEDFADWCAQDECLEVSELVEELLCTLWKAGKHQGGSLQKTPRGMAALLQTFVSSQLADFELEGHMVAVSRVCDHARESSLEGLLVVQNSSGK